MLSLEQSWSRTGAAALAAGDTRPLAGRVITMRPQRRSLGSVRPGPSVSGARAEPPGPQPRPCRLARNGALVSDRRPFLPSHPGPFRASIRPGTLHARDCGPVPVAGRDPRCPGCAAGARPGRGASCHRSDYPGSSDSLPSLNSPARDHVLRRDSWRLCMIFAQRAPHILRKAERSVRPESHRPATSTGHRRVLRA